MHLFRQSERDGLEEMQKKHTAETKIHRGNFRKKGMQHGFEIENTCGAKDGLLQIKFNMIFLD